MAFTRRVIEKNLAQGHDFRYCFVSMGIVPVKSGLKGVFMNFVLQNVLVVSGISGLLALVLVLAEAWLANYGQCKITINNGKKVLEVKGGTSLLGVLTAQKVFIPSACGGRGSCGFCKVTVLEGGGPLLPTEKPFLSAKEIADNVRLSCQVKVKQDISIQLPEEIFSIKRFTATVAKIEDYTYDIKGVDLRLIDPPEMEFKAGQYIQLVVPPYGNIRESVSRAYSMSGPPHRRNEVQVIIRRVPDGICTTWVHDYLKVGDTVNLTGPFGDFYCRDTNADIFFVAGGSGLAPIRSMMEHFQKVGCDRRMVFFFGARTVKDLYLTEEFYGFEKVFRDFTFVPVLSNPEPDCGWKGRKGYVLPYIEEMMQNPGNTEAYLCGSPGMINSVVKILQSLKVPADKIFYDSFA